MKKLYIILAVVFIMVAAGLIYFGNQGTGSDNEIRKEEIEKSMRKQGTFKADRVQINKSVRRQMDKDTLKKMILIKQKDKQEPDKKKGAEETPPAKDQTAK